jgi:hypothetical protein
MSWTKLDDGIYDHPKLLRVEPTDRLLYVWALCWSNRHGTNGSVPPSALPLLATLAGVANANDAAERLVNAGLWHLGPDGWSVHDFGDYQPSPDKVDQIRQARSEAGRKGGRASAEGRKGGNGSSKPEANAEANAQANHQHDPSNVVKQNPTPSRPVPQETFTSSSRPVYEELSTGRDEDEPIAAPEPDPTTEARARAVAAILGERDSKASPVTVGAPALHVRRCIETRWAVEGAELIALARQHPDLEPEALADRMRQPGQAVAQALHPSAGPPPAPVGPCVHCGHPARHHGRACWTRIADETIADELRAEDERDDEGEP